MKWLHGPDVFKSSETRSVSSYDEVALEYYDATLHPTCADFRVASRIFLQRFFATENPRGRIADIGCGLSLLREFTKDDLVLVDQSAKMLLQNKGSIESRLLNIEISGFGVSEFDWVFAILADPFNSVAAWKNICLSLRNKGVCVFVVPSYCWASKFRKNTSDERDGLAHFVKGDGSSVFLPSLINSEADQTALITSVGLRVANFSQMFVRDLPKVGSYKISQFLSENDALLDIYRVEKY